MKKRYAVSGRCGRLCRFTLIELLVVVVIIAVLAALILAVTSNSREAGERAQCISNQRNFGEYIHSFAMENNGSLKGLLGNWKNWLGQMAKTAGSSYEFPADGFARFEEGKIDAIAQSILKIAHCPSDASSGAQSYGRNDPRGGWTMTDHSKKVCQSRIPDVRMPADLIIIGERWSNFKNVASNSDDQYEICAPFHLRPNRTASDATGENWDSIHKGIIPLLYLDGHVAYGSIYSTLRGQDPSRLYQYFESSTGGSWSDDPDLKR
ncbi:MAG: prepilin-type N-terminal cleavage/methylation domain-containing protein [Lentisphaeria bacterium]|nr:prepilin-type N-terminal cleavage/methylation domain-containing protein [Lentisphaeria bacterium]